MKKKLKGLWPVMSRALFASSILVLGFIVAKSQQRRRANAKNAALSPEGTSRIRTQSTRSSSSKEQHPSGGHQGSQTSSPSCCRELRQCWLNGSSIVNGSIEAGKRLAAKARAMLRRNASASTPSSLPAHGPSISPTKPLAYTQDQTDWLIQRALQSGAKYSEAMCRMRSLEVRTPPATERSHTACERMDSSSLKGNN